MRQIFSIAAPSNSPYITIGAIIAIVLALALVFILIAAFIRNVKVVVDDDQIVFKSIFFGKTIAFSKIEKDGIRVVDLNQERDLLVAYIPTRDYAVLFSAEDASGLVAALAAALAAALP